MIITQKQLDLAGWLSLANGIVLPILFICVVILASSATLFSENIVITVLAFSVFPLIKHGLFAYTLLSLKKLLNIRLRFWIANFPLLSSVFLNLALFFFSLLIALVVLVQFEFDKLSFVYYCLNFYFYMLVALEIANFFIGFILVSCSLIRSFSLLLMASSSGLVLSSIGLILSLNSVSPLPIGITLIVILSVLLELVTTIMLGLTFFKHSKSINSKIDAFTS
ncbi:MAG: hypothetical protein AB1589_35205 [Cyanobacteriota bacterium]